MERAAIGPDERAEIVRPSPPRLERGQPHRRASQLDDMLVPVGEPRGVDGLVEPPGKRSHPLPPFWLGCRIRTLGRREGRVMRSSPQAVEGWAKEPALLRRRRVPYVGCPT